MAAEAQAPTLSLARREAALQVRLSGLGTLNSSISSLQSSLADLQNLSTFSASKATSSDEDILTATTFGQAAEVNYDIDVTTLAESHKLATDPTLPNAQFTAVLVAYQPVENEPGP